MKYFYLIILGLGYLTYGYASSLQTELENIGARFGAIKTRCSEINDKEVTVFIGNTGTGKTTLSNLLAGIPMKLNGTGNFINIGNQGGRVGSGSTSITKEPSWLPSEKLGWLIDFPGLRDSNGVLDDIINAFSIREILLGASKVRFVFLTTSHELGAVQGETFGVFADTFKMVDSRILTRSSMLVVNQCELARVLAFHEEDPDVFSTLLSNGQFYSGENFSFDALKQKVFFLPAPTYRSQEDFIKPFLNELERQIAPIQGDKITTMDVSEVYAYRTQRHIESFYLSLMRETQKKVYEKIDHSILQLPLEGKEKCWSLVRDQVEQTNAYQILHQLTNKQYKRALEDFEMEFDRKHALVSKVLRLKEGDEQLKVSLDHIKQLKDSLSAGANDPLLQQQIKIEEQEVWAKTNELHELSSLRVRELCEQFQIARDERNQAAEALKNVLNRAEDASLSLKEREEAEKEKDIRQAILNESNQKVQFFENILKKFAEIVEPLTNSIKKAASLIGKNLEVGIQKAGPIIEKAIEVLADRAVTYVLSKMFIV